MRLRVLLVCFILSALTTIGIDVFVVKHRMATLQSDLQQESAARRRFEGKAKMAGDDLAKAAVNLKGVQLALSTARSETVAAQASADFQRERVRKLGAELAETQAERDKALASLAEYQESGLSPEEVADLWPRIQKLKRDLAAAQKEGKSLRANLDSILGEPRPCRDGPIELPSAFRARVEAVDPKWRFIVLNAGVDQGVLRYAELLVSRGGRFVAKVKVTKVDAKRSVANVMSGWEQGEILEGDQLIPAHQAAL